MITISAFADEIGPDLGVQMDTCQGLGVRCIDVRGIDGVNVSKMTLAQAREYRRRMDGRGFSVPCVGSPIGKIRLSDDFPTHLELLKHVIELAGIFGTKSIRVFSFYAAEGENILEHRGEVLGRMAAMVKTAQAADVVLYHENEKGIYGAKPAAVLDLFEQLGGEHFKGVFDPSNYVEEGIRPYDEGWTNGLDRVTAWFHVKDSRGGRQCVPAGEGDAQFREIFAELKRRNWSGVMTLEPHLSASGQFAGFTGPGLFGKAVDALRGLMQEAELEEEKRGKE
ncbi:MAG: sugar phosphate isomerase/epimerase [Planctomycetota bacterium]|nr:sugar phosphate isomerase/epimerase [Planctomycetota bacterium]